MLDLNQVLVHLEVFGQFLWVVGVFRDLVVDPGFDPVPVPAAGVSWAFQSQQISQETTVIIEVSNCVDYHVYSLSNSKVVRVVSVVVNILA